ncbi:hypothetical protein D3C78_1211910 [compost metagenome]
MRQQFVDVQAGGVVHRAGVVLRGNDLGAGFMEQAGGGAAHVAKALHHHARLGDVDVEVAGGFARHHEHATAGSFHTAQATAQGDRLAGDHAGGGGAFVHGIRVHHPGHGLGVGVHVRGGNVFRRPDDHADFGRVAARHALEFGLRQVARINTDTALGAAIRQVHRGVLDRHPGRQRHHFGQGHILVETHAAFARTARHVVLHAIALEVGDRAIVQFDRHVDDQRALRALQRLDPPAQRAKVRGDPVDLLQVITPGAEVIGIQIRRQGMGGRLRHEHDLLTKLRHFIREKYSVPI